MSKPEAVRADKVGTFVLYLYDRADGISKVHMEVASDVVPVVGETATVRVVEVVREVVER